jgi:serine/threonine protein kinase
MKAWQELFDLSWLLTMRISSSQIDMQLMNYNGHTASQMLKTTQSLRKVLQGTAGPAEGIFKPKLEDARIEEIPFSTAKVARRSGSSKLTVLDPAPYIVQGELDQLMTNVRNLARKLKYGDPLQFGLMEGDGVIREQNPSDPSQIMFTFVFKPISGHSQPRSLRASLLSNETDHSLSDRVQIANDLAKAVIFVHTFGFVHKNICPENILLSTDDPLSLGHSYLVGFGAFRNAEGHTWRRGDDAWERNLYRHQQRQGPFPDEHYIMQHDIYSLGVCLLEVGLWESFVLYDESGKCGPSPAFSESLAACGRASNKDCFVLLARKVLPRRMGTKYARIVETCLTCLDNGNTDFGDESEFQDVDGVLVGVRYIEKVRHPPDPRSAYRLTCTSGSFGAIQSLYLIYRTSCSFMKFQTRFRSKFL